MSHENEKALQVEMLLGEKKIREKKTKHQKKKKNQLGYVSDYYCKYLGFWFLPIGALYAAEHTNNLLEY